MKKNFISRHQEIHDDLFRRIRNEEWRKGERLPSLQQLCRAYAVSLVTVNTAMRDLAGEGMIVMKRGSGSYVQWSPECDYFSSINRPKTVKSKTVTITHSLLNATPMYEFLLRQLAETFMQTNPDVEIKFLKWRSNETGDPYLQKIADGTLPTCGEFFWHAAYAKLDALMPLEQLPGFDELCKDLLPQAAYPTLNGQNIPHIHALYLYFGISSIMMYDTNLLGIVPEKSLSWTQCMKIQKEISRRYAPSANVWGGALPRPHAWHSVRNYLELMGQEVFAGKYNPNAMESFREILLSDGALIGLELLAKIRDSGRILLGSENEYFAMGKVGVLPFAHSWTLNLLDSFNRSESVYACRIPELKKNQRYRSFYAGSSIGIFRNTGSSDLQQETAWNWLKFLFFPKSQYLFSQDQNLPTRLGVKPYLAESHPLINQITRITLPDTISQPDFVGMRPAFTMLGQEILTFLKMHQTPGECIANIRRNLAHLPD